MNKPGYLLLGCLCLAVMLTAGCINLVNPTPNQVNVHDNIIVVNPEYISNPFIWSLLLHPNDYDAGMIQEIDNWVQPNDPVIEIGAGVGVVTAYLNDMIIIPTAQVSVEPNPYLIESLKQTRSINTMGYTLVQKAVAYGSSEITMSIESEIMQNKITEESMFSNTITVPTTTVEELAENAGFSGNITLVMNILGEEHEVIQHEAEYISTHVDTIIAAVYTDGRNTPETFAMRMKYLGFEEREQIPDTAYNYIAMAFTKADTTTEVTTTATEDMTNINTTAVENLTEVNTTETGNITEVNTTA